MSLWQQVVQMHVQAQWGLLVPFYGGIGLALYLVISEVLRFRASARAKNAQERVEQLEEVLKSLNNQQEHMAAVQRQERQKTSEKMEELSERMTREVAAAGASRDEQMERFCSRLTELEERIPSLHEHLEDFRVTLSGIFQSELGSVMNAFDNSVSCVLQHMRDQLQMGLCTLEGIESMVKGRQKAERHLLGPTSEADQAEDPIELAADMPAASGEDDVPEMAQELEEEEAQVDLAATMIMEDAPEEPESEAA